MISKKLQQKLAEKNTNCSVISFVTHAALLVRLKADTN